MSSSERLVHFMGDRRRQLSERGHTRDMREIRLRFVQFGFGFLRPGLTSETAPTRKSMPLDVSFTAWALTWTCSTEPSGISSPDRHARSPSNRSDHAPPGDP